MGPVYDAVRQIHVPVALSCIIAFWIAVVTKKGAKLHIRSGRWFAYGMMLTAASGTFLACHKLGHPATRPTAIFLIYLGTITFVPPLHGVAVIRTRKNPERLATPLYRAVLILPMLGSIAAIGWGVMSAGGMQPLLLAMSPIGIVLSLGALSYTRTPNSSRMRWWYEHMIAMLAAGIAAHTAGAIFVVGQMLEIRLPGVWQMLPWILPSLIGVPAIIIWTRKWTDHFGEG